MSTDYSFNDYDLYAVVDKSKKKSRNSEGRLDKSFSKSTTQVSNIRTDIYAEVHKIKPKSKSVYGGTKKTAFSMTTEFTGSNFEIPDEMQRSQMTQETLEDKKIGENDGPEFGHPESSLYAVISKSNDHHFREETNQNEEHDPSKNYAMQSSLSTKKYFSLFAANIVAFSFIAILSILVSVAMWKISKVEFKHSNIEEKLERLEVDMNMLRNTFFHYTNSYNANFISISNSITSLNLTVQNVKDNKQPLTEYLTSCSGIALYNPSFPSGIYNIRMSPDSEKIAVYCDLNRTFGGNTTGWRRIVNLDVNNCQQGLETKYVNNSTSTCVKNIPESCTDMKYATNGFLFTKVAGRVRGYANGSMECFEPYNSSMLDHQSNYISGVSIINAAEHVWSFAAGCDCNDISNIPPFVGEDFTADEIDLTQSGDGFVNLLWESQQCNRNSTWFLKVLSYPTSEIAVKFCHDRGAELAITVLELYVQ